MSHAVAVLNAPPVFYRGMADVLHDAGYDLETFEGAETWHRRHHQRSVALVVVHDAEDLQLVVDLRASAPETVVVTLLDIVTTETVQASIQAGAISTLGMYAGADDVAMVIAAAFRDQSVVPWDIITNLAERTRQPAPAPPLTDGELQWLRSLAAGETIATLAGRAGYSEREMHRKLRRVYRRLGSTTRTTALLRASRCGLLD